MTNGQYLDWMMWRIESDQRGEPHLVNLIQAMQYFSEKYEGVPNRCEAPAGWSDGLAPPAGMTVVETSNLPAHHLRLAYDPALGERGVAARSE